MTDELESIVRLANRYIEEGRSVRLYSTIDRRVCLQVFSGSQWTGGVWEKVAQTSPDTIFQPIPNREYSCKRKFVVTDDWSIALTPCEGECVQEVRQGQFVDYTKICDLKE